MGKCGSVVDAAQETLVLAFKVADDTILDSPDTIQRILTNVKVRQAIEKTAQSQARELVEKQRKGLAVSQDDVKNGLKKVATAAGNVAKDVGLKELEKSAKSSKHYKKLEQSLKELECSFKKSPVGIFVDKHKGFLILVGSGLALQGAIAMYHFRAGDEVTVPVTALASKLVKFTVLGNIEIAAKEITFKPSERLIGTKMMATGKWSRVTAKFELGVTFQDSDLSKANTRAEVAVKVVKGITAKAHAGYNYSAPSPDADPQNLHQYDLGLGLDYDNAFGLSRLTVQTMVFGRQDATTTKVGGKASAKVKIVNGTEKSPFNMSIQADASGHRVLDQLPPLPGAAALPQNEFRTTLGIVGHF